MLPKYLNTLYYLYRQEVISHEAVLFTQTANERRLSRRTHIKQTGLFDSRRSRPVAAKRQKSKGDGEPSQSQSPGAALFTQPMRRECQEGPTSNIHRLFDSRRSRAAARNRQNSKVDGMSDQSQSPETTANTINEPTALFRARSPKKPFSGLVSYQLYQICPCLFSGQVWTMVRVTRTQ